MTKMAGHFEIDGRDYSWTYVLGGDYSIDLGAFESIRMQGAPDVEHARIAIRAYEQGKSMGIMYGRKHLAYDIKRLLEL